MAKIKQDQCNKLRKRKTEPKFPVSFAYIQTAITNGRQIKTAKKPFNVKC
jgi:hypothetical protein